MFRLPFQYFVIIKPAMKNVSQTFPPVIKDKIYVIYSHGRLVIPQTWITSIMSYGFRSSHDYIEIGGMMQKAAGTI